VAARPLGHPAHRHAGEQVRATAVEQLTGARVLAAEALALPPQQRGEALPIRG